MESRRNKILGRLGLAVAVSACADQQFGTHSHRIGYAKRREQFKRKFKNWLFEAGGTYDRRW